MNPKPYLISAALFAAVSFSQAGEKIQQSQLPSAVQRALTSNTDTAKSGPIKEITKKTVDGKVVYEVEFEKDNAINPRLRIAEDGTVMTRSGLAAATDDAAAATRSATASAAAATRDMRQSADRRLDSARRDLTAVDSESMLQLSELPMAVRATIQKEAAGREIVDIDEETWEGRKVYEVEFAQSGVNAQIHVAEDGSIVKTEKKSGIRSLFAGTQLEDTPAAVQATIKREVGNLEIADIDKERRTGRVVYEVEVNDPKGKWQIHVAEDGSIVKDDRAVAE